MTKLAGATTITTRIGTKIVSMISLVIAVSMISYSGIVLYDSVYTNREAFASSDLTKFRPTIAEAAEPDFEELQEINTDTCGWITMNGTHIDYPVMQGEDDLEYSTKDVYGKSSLTGSIYLASNNTNDFTNTVNLIYGHHMDNGAMFGDIEKYDDPDYFNSHKDGIIVTSNGAYDLHVFARLAADAYDTRLYSVGEDIAEDPEDYLNYLKSLAVQWDPSVDVETLAEGIEEYTAAREENINENGTFVLSKMPEHTVKNGKQLMAMSTCMDTTTNGRQVIVASMSVRTEPLPEEMIIEDQPVPMAAWGHNEAGHWALLNLICLIMTIIILLPGKAIIKKIRKVFGEDEEEENDEAACDMAEIDEEEDPESDKKKLQRILGIIAQVIIAIGALVLFIRTEDLTQPMVVIDKWTLAMIILFAATWAIDVFVIKYAREKEQEEEPEDSTSAMETSFTVA
jgi:SrtB family sortase